MAIQASLIEELEEVLEQLLIAVHQLVKMYCRAFHADFILGSPVRKDWSKTFSNPFFYWFLLTDLPPLYSLSRWYGVKQ